MHPALLTLVLILAADPEPGRVWPGFRGTGDSRTAAKNLPLKWSADEGIAWKARLPGYGQSSPVVWNDRVFVTAIEGDTKERLHLLCFELKTGKELWKKEFKGTQKVKISDYTSKGAPTPGVDAERVYALFESGDLIALDHDGKELWQRHLTTDYGEFKNNHGLGSSPVLSADTVLTLVAHDGTSYLLAVDKKTGKNVWRTEHTFGSCWTSPTVSSKGTVVTSTAGTVAAFDLKDGKLVWELSGLKGNTVASPTLDGEIAVIGSSERDGNVAIKLAGKGQVKADQVAWKTEEATSSFASPLIHAGHVYYTNRAGTAYCTDLKSGKTVWTSRLPASCWASPLGAGDRVYFFCTNGETIVFKTGAKEERLAENALPGKDRIYGIAAVEGAMVLRTGTTLYRVGTTK